MNNGSNSINLCFQTVDRNMDAKTKCLLIAAVFRVHFEYSGYER